LKTFAQSAGTAAMYSVSAPVLKATMRRFVVRIASQQHVPLRAGVEDPENCLENLTSGNRLAARASRRNVFLQKMVPDTFPVFVAQP
jgi:hypothetical protein